MPLALISHDKPGQSALRMQVRPAHLAYLQERKHFILAGGPLLDLQGQPCGSLQILDLDDRAAAEAFAEADPYTQAGLFEKVEVTAWRKVYFNFESEH